MNPPAPCGISSCVMLKTTNKRPEGILLARLHPNMHLTGKKDLLYMFFLRLTFSSLGGSDCITFPPETERKYSIRFKYTACYQFKHHNIPSKNPGSCSLAKHIKAHTSPKTILLWSHEIHFWLCCNRIKRPPHWSVTVFWQRSIASIPNYSYKVIWYWFTVVTYTGPQLSRKNWGL